METNINLLPEKAKLKFAQAGKLNQIKAGLVMMTVLFVLFSISVLVFNIRLRKEEAVLKSRLEAVEKKVEAQKAVELQAFLLKERVDKISKILEERKNVGRLLWEVLTVLPQKMSIKQAEANSQKIQVVFEAPTHSDAGSFVDSFPQKEIEKLGGAVVSFPSVRREEEGNYLLELKIGF